MKNTRLKSGWRTAEVIPFGINFLLQRILLKIYLMGNNHQPIRNTRPELCLPDVALVAHPEKPMEILLYWEKHEGQWYEFTLY